MSEGGRKYVGRQTIHHQRNNKRRKYSSLIKDANIARSTFDKFAEANNLRPVKIEKRGKKFYTLKDKVFVVNHYQSGKGKEEKESGKGKEEKEKYTNHKAEKHDEIVDLLREQVRQLKQANEQLIHDNDILTEQLSAKDGQIAAAHKLADQAQQLHLSLEQRVKALDSSDASTVLEGETTSEEKEESTQQVAEDNKKSFWSKIFGG